MRLRNYLSIFVFVALSYTSGITGPTDTRAQSFAGNYVHVFNPRLLNELGIGYTRRKIERQATQLDSSPSQTLHLAGDPQVIQLGIKNF